VLLGLVLLLAGTAWWVGVLVFLLTYNVLHLGLRVWGLRRGAEAGLDVGRVLRDAPLQSLGRRAADVGAVLAGFAVVLAAAPTGREPVALAMALAAATLGYWLGSRARTIFAVMAAAVWVVAVLMGLTGHGA
jgi:hypothetical protein